MPRTHAPRRGTLQFWPRTRAHREHAYIRTWPGLKEAKPCGFLGYKAGMCHISVVDNRPKSLTKGEEISYPVTIIECPPMAVIGANFYRKSLDGLHIVSTVLASTFGKELSRILTLQKTQKSEKKVSDVTNFDDLRLLVATQPYKTGIGSKKPKISEIALGGKKEDKIAYVQEKLGKEIVVADVFGAGNLVDAHVITKGKGFQGPVKRHGVMLRHHKSEKSRRANIRGPWTGPKMWTVPHSGQMGFNQRVEYNKLILKIGEDGKEATPLAGLKQYGIVKNHFLLMKGSIGGARKRVVTLTHALRPAKNNPKDAPEIKEILL
jgi:large subunit ribosomal protein L3